jgi:proline iminopeptidase
LVADIEALRAHLGIETWQVLGGSWGSTLALAYAQSHVERVTELILRGIFAIRKREIDWFYQEGASMLFPDVWETYLAPIPVPEREDLVAAYYRRLTGTDSHEQMACAKAWSQWEASTLSLRPNPQLISEFGGDAFAMAFARIECHYFVNKGFFDRDGQLLADAPKLRAIPGVIIQGRYDVVTPMDTAWSLHRAWPEAAFEIIPDAGHTATEPGITDALIRATDRFAMRAPHS